MSISRDLITRFDDAVASSPNAIALAYPDREFTFGQLEKLSASFALKFQSHGVSAGSLIQVAASDPIVELASFLACFRVGARVLLDPTLDLEGDAIRFHDDPQGPWARPGSTVIDGSWSPSLVLAEHADIELRGADRDQEAPWLFSARMTEDGPKVAALGEADVLHRVDLVGRGVGNSTRLVLLSPLHSTDFLFRALAVLLGAGTLVIGSQPSAWEEMGVTWVSGPPEALVGVVDALPSERRLPKVEVTGAQPSSSLLMRLLSKFELIENPYSTFETGVCYVNTAKLNPDGSAEWAGQPVHGTVAILDRSGTKVEKGKVGRIHVALATGGSVPDWHQTEDLAYWGDNHALVVFSRRDDVLNVLGRKIPGRVVDEIIASVNGINQAACFKNPKPDAEDELFAYCRFEEGINQMQAIASAKYKVRKALGETFVPKVFREVGGIPARADGKAPDRRACANFLLEIYRKRLLKAEQDVGKE